MKIRMMIIKQNYRQQRERLQMRSLQKQNDQQAIQLLMQRQNQTVKKVQKEMVMLKMKKVLVKANTILVIY